MPVQAARRVKRASTERYEQVAAPGSLGPRDSAIARAIGRHVNLAVSTAHSSAQKQTVRGLSLF